MWPASATPLPTTCLARLTRLSRRCAASRRDRRTAPPFCSADRRGSSVRGPTIPPSRGISSSVRPMSGLVRVSSAIHSRMRFHAAQPSTIASTQQFVSAPSRTQSRVGSGCRFTGIRAMRQMSGSETLLHRTGSTTSKPLTVFEVDQKKTPEGALGSGMEPALPPPAYRSTTPRASTAHGDLRPMSTILRE